MGVQINGSEGNVIATKGTYSGNVTIGGTLTYEDVTNIDSVGLVTARTGIEIGARPGVAASISVDGNMVVSGISTFNDKVLLGTTTEGNSSADNLTIADSGESGITVRSGTSNGGHIYFSDATSGTAEYQGAVSYQHGGDFMKFHTGATEKARIDSSGKFGIGMNSDQKTALKGKLDIDASGIDAAGDTDDPNDYAIVIRNPSSTNSGNGIAFTNDSGAAVGGAIIHIDKGTNNIGDLAFLTSASSNTPVERLRIDSSGRLLLGTATARAVGGESNPRLHIEGTGATSNSWVNLTRFSANNGSPNIQFAKSRSNTAGDYTIVQDGDNLGQISFLGADGTDMANYAALIKSQVNGTPGANDMPGKLVFATTSDGATFPTPRMEINSAGIVTCRTVPSFKISIDTDASPNQGVVSENNGFTLSEFRDGFNEGNHFSESTGRFTAPVEGLYYFHFSLMRYSNNGSGSVEMRIKRNSGQILARAYKANYTQNFESHNVSTITRLLAGHYVEFVIGVNMSTYNDDSYMMGYLIG